MDIELKKEAASKYAGVGMHNRSKVFVLCYQSTPIGDHRGAGSMLEC